MTSKLYLAFITCGLYSVPAYAEQVTIQSFDPPRADGVVGIITHNNMVTQASGAEMTLDTPYGPVVMRLDMTPNSQCDPACPDTLEVWSLPDNIIAIPSAVTTPENAQDYITLYEWAGM